MLPFFYSVLLGLGFFIGRGGDLMLRTLSLLLSSLNIWKSLTLAGGEVFSVFSLFVMWILPKSANDIDPVLLL